MIQIRPDLEKKSPVDECDAEKDALSQTRQKANKRLGLFPIPERKTPKAVKLPGGFLEKPDSQDVPEG